MMQFAVNYSLQAAELLRTGKIAVDCFKCPDWPDLVATVLEQHPAYVHFNLRAGPGKMAQTDWQHVSRLLEQTDTPYVNLHLYPDSSDFPTLPADTTDPTHARLITARLIEDTNQAIQHFSAGQVIVENVPPRAHNSPLHRPVADPAVIREVVCETGCGLLLDVSHARIAAYLMGIDEYAYLAQMPVEHLRELHITGLAQIEGEWHDHMPITPADWPVLEWVFERIAQGDWPQPWVVALEYGGIGEVFAHRSDPQVIAEQVPRLYELVQAAAR